MGLSPAKRLELPGVGINGRGGSACRARGEHCYLASKKFCYREYRVALLCSDAVFVLLPFFADQQKSCDGVINMSVDAFLRSGKAHFKRLPRKILLFKNFYNRAVLTRALPRAVHVIKIGNGMREPVPIPIVVHELGVCRF